MLLRTAYRMLGSLADAEDVVQEAWLRWSGVDQDEVKEPAAFLRRVVTRLSLDVLKSARAKREEYVGPWLPDPIIEERPVEDVTLPLLLALAWLLPLAGLIAAVVIGVILARRWSRAAAPAPSAPADPVDRARLEAELAELRERA